MNQAPRDKEAWVQRVLDAFWEAKGGARGSIERRDADTYRARSPLREDEDASVSIKVNRREGRILITDHVLGAEISNNEKAELIDALDLTWSDLFRDAHSEEDATLDTTEYESMNREPDPGFLSPTDISQYRDAITTESLAPVATRLGLNTQTLRLFDFGFDDQHKRLLEFETNLSGTVIGAKSRYHNPRHRKDKHSVPKSHRGIVGASALRFMRLWDDDEDAPIFVTEGSSDLYSIVEMGLHGVARSSAGDTREIAELIASIADARIVVVIGDNDNGGVAGAKKSAELIATANPEVRVYIITPPDGINDVREWYNKRGKETAKSELLDMVDAAEVVNPVAVPHAREVAPLPTFDMSTMFPPSCDKVSRFIRALARSTQVPEEMPALLALGVTSACLANVAKVRGHGDHIEPAQIWSLVLSESGTRKSSVLQSLVSPIVEWERDERDRLQSRIDEAEHVLAIAKARQSKLQQKAAGTIETGDDGEDGQRGDFIAELNAISQEIREAESITTPVLLAAEPTPEALARQMMANHERALIASAESDGIDIVMGRYTNQANLGMWLKGHAGDPVRAPRVGREGDFIDSPALAVALAVQPEAVRAVWGDPQAEGRGFVARFAVVAPESRVGKREVRPAPVSERAREGWRQTLRNLLSHAPNGDPVVIELDPAADSVYHELQKRIEASLGDGDLATRRAWGSKLAGLSLRIALTLHAMGTWAQSGSPGDHPAINRDTMLAAIAWAEYLIDAERYARGEIASREVRRLIAWIQEHGGTPTVREIGRALYGGSKQRAEAVIDEVVSSGSAKRERPKPGKRGGAPSEVVRLLDAS